ncbi:MAG: hypothetical protein FWH49_04610 [Clostridiales bacterium]|nr:hypothetical protein [Clostridiales bacterium]
MGLLDRLFRKKSKESSVQPISKTPARIDKTPDYPIPFGHNTTWYAIKDVTPQEVIEKLELDLICESNWESGLAYVHFSDDVFVSPGVGGYVLVIDLLGLTRNADHDMVREHGRLFDEFFYFGSHTVADYYAWAKFKNGNLIRAYAFIGDAGELFWNEGSITAEEMQLGFDQFPVSDEPFEDDAVIPDEENVMDIASAWSINPSFDGANLEKSTGYICRLKS